jgi:hypothetical protein
MSSDNWTAGSGDWATGANWSSGAAPTASSDVVINNVGSGYAGAGVSIAAATKAAAHSVALNSSNLTALGSLTIAGTLALNSSYLTLDGGTVTATSIEGGNGYDEIYGHGTVNATLSTSVYVTADGGKLTINGALDNGFDGYYIDGSSTLD